MSASDIIGAVSCIAPYTVDPIVKQVKYVFNYKQNLTNLPKEVKKLMDLKLEVEGLVSSARENAEDIKDSVREWMKEADQTAEAASQIIREEEEESKKRCFIPLCPNPVSRHRSSRKAFKQTMQIVEVQTAGREFKEGSVSFPVSAVPSFPVTVTLGKDFLDFNSRSKTWEEIMKALKDPVANVIGVYGMGGLGKTTLVNKVAARAAEEKLFDEVVEPVVTEKNVLDAKVFQDEMAKALNMKMDDQWNKWNVSQRADRIFKRLMQKTGDEKVEKKTGDEKKMEKKILVILDDLRAKLDFEKVGIPLVAGNMGCKILFTSRFQSISYVAQNKITLGVLEEEEAWRLFQKTAGDALEDPVLCNVGQEVTKNCKGLPILIVTVAGTLGCRRSLGVWKHALVNLEREGSKEMQEFVDSALEFISFNLLSEDKKSLFLLCGLLGGGEISIFDQLLKLGIGWGLFKQTKTTEEARNNLENLILDLKASFLLLDGQSVDTVRMHDVVRDVAIKIASNEGHNMLLGSSDNWPEDDVLRKCTALTFPSGIVPELPECLESPSLKFLLLYHNQSKLKSADNLFEKMQNLVVLDVRSVNLFPKLPSSLALLENLHTLSLNLCKLSDISIVGALKKLKILSLNNTGIILLPMVIGDLSELKVLDLNGCSELEVIPPGVIKRLSRLEELHMAKSFSHWEVEGLTSSERRNASLSELKYLPRLTTLRIHIPDAKVIPKDFSFKKLERFTILIGDEEWDWACHDDQSLFRSRGIKIKVNSNRNIHLEAGVQELLKRTEILYLDGMKNIHELEWKLLQELKFVNIRRSTETHYIVNAVESFPAGLESLHLSDLPQLQNLCRGTLMAESPFTKLKYVNVNSCNNLRHLFPFSMVRGLPHLEKIEITNCDSLEAIVEDTREDGKNGDTAMDKVEFCQLRSLILESLPKLDSFCSSLRNSSIISNGRKLVTTDDMESEDGCITVAPFFSEKVLFPELKEFTLGGCYSIEYLFNQSTVMGLEQLHFITIQHCGLLKAIVAHVERKETNESIEFPQLCNLSLEGLPCLTRFGSGCSVVFPTLTSLLISDCQQLKTFVGADTISQDKTVTSLFDEKVELPTLKTLLLKKMDNVETIWHNGLHEDSFFKLEQVDIRYCPNLLEIFPSTMLTRIQSLEALLLHDVCLVEEVFGNDETSKPNISRGQTSEEDKIKFSRLRSLQLWNMSNLKQFCSGSCVAFPALTLLEIFGCEQIETFVYAIGVSNSRRKGVEDMDSNDMQPFFNEKVEFPSLKTLVLENLDNLKIIWDSQMIHEDSFGTLEELIVRECANLLSVFPLAILGRIQTTPGRGEASDQSGDGAEDEIVFSRLNTLELVELPSLVHFYLGNCILKFPLLEQVTVTACFNMEAFCGGITITPELKTVFLNDGKMNLGGYEDDEDLNTIIKEAHRRTGDCATRSSKRRYGVELYALYDDSIESITKTRMVTELGKKSQIVTEIVQQGRRLERPVQFQQPEPQICEFMTTHEANIEDEICENGNESGTEIEMSDYVTEPEQEGEISYAIGKQYTRAHISEDPFECGKEVAEPEQEGEISYATGKQYTRAQIFEDPFECGKPEQEGEIYYATGKQYTGAQIFEDPLECGKVVAEPEQEGQIYYATCKQYTRAAQIFEDPFECGKKVAEPETNDKVEMHGEDTKPLEEAETCEKVKQSKKNDRIYKKIVEPSEEVHTDTKAGNRGSLAPTADIVDVTCPSSQSHLALGTGMGATDNEFEGLQVAQHLVPLLEKARDRHGDFHANTLFKSRTMRIAAMKSVGQVLHILQTQPPRAIDAEKIQFMEDAFHDLSLMSFHIEWLRPLIDKARKCLFCLEKEAKIDEMEVQLQVLKRELEMEKALIDLDRPLLDI